MITVPVYSTIGIPLIPGSARPVAAATTYATVMFVELRGYDALIVPSGIVSDRLRYTEDISRLAPATDLLQRALAEPRLLKGIICHGMWLASWIPSSVRGRKVVCHNNLIGDVRNMGAEYVDEDVVIDDDLVTGRTGQHCHLFARTVIDQLMKRRQARCAGPMSV